MCWNICKYNAIFFCFFNHIKKPLLVNKEFTAVIVRDIVETKSGTFVSIMLYLVSAFDVTFRPHWLLRKAMEHKHNVTQYRSKYQTLIIKAEVYADFDFHRLSFHLQSECLCKTFPMKIKITWFSCKWLYRWHIFMPILLHKDSFATGTKVNLGLDYSSTSCSGSLWLIHLYWNAGMLVFKNKAWPGVFCV